MSTSLRVALLCHYPDDDIAPAGGVWAVGRNLAAGLVAAGADVHVVRYVSGSAAGTQVSGQSPLTVHTVQLPRRRSQPLRRIAAVPALVACLRDIRPDAITAHESEYGLAAVRSGLPAAVTIHGIPRQEFRAFNQPRMRADLALTIWQDCQMVREVKHIVAINEYAWEQYRQRTRAQFHRINVPIGDVFFDVTPREPDPLTILIVGGMNERKDPFTLLWAVAELRRSIPAVRVRIAGRIPSSEFGERLTAFIGNHDLDENVQFLGALNQPALAEAYASSALTALSSRQETSPAVLMEAMAARRPVVATDVGGVREIVADGESGLITPAGDAEALAAAIGRVLSDPHQAHAMGERGRALAERGYRRTLIGRQYVDLLARLASPPKS
jgi:glycosyltransferase involved in cell wall biosynthesis